MKENSRRRVLFGILFSVVALYVFWTMISNRLITGTSPEDDLPTDCDLDAFVLNPALNQTDPCLVAFFKKTMLIPPRSPESVKTIPFNKEEVDIACNMKKLKWVLLLLMDGSPQDTLFFVETGAHDGRFLSSTVRLETLFGWNGVLIEPQPKEFRMLLKNRMVWAVNAALCVTRHPEYVSFYVNRFSSGSGLQFTKKSLGTKVKLPCIPLYTILAALNVDVVDYLSLDIEGAELEVLKTVPFDKVIFKVIIVEYAHIPGGNQIGQLMEFLEPKGYHSVANITMHGCADSLFVHESVYNQKKSIINYLHKDQFQI